MYVGVHHNDNSLHVGLHIHINLSSHLWLIVSVLCISEVAQLRRRKIILVHMGHYIISLIFLCKISCVIKSVPFNITLKHESICSVITCPVELVVFFV